MKEFIDKLIERLEGQIFSFEERLNYDSKTQKQLIIQNNSIKRAISIVNELAEEYKGGWIPCERDLPKENEFVIASIHPREWINGGNPIIITRYDSISASYWNNGTIYAWMPLPAPYTEGE